MISIEKNEIESLLLTIAQDSSFDICSICENNVPCAGCLYFSKGKGVFNERQNYFDWDWTCKDFNICAVREGTPCDGCCYGDSKATHWGKGFSLDLLYKQREKEDEGNGTRIIK